MYSIIQLNKNVMLCFTCVSKYRHLLREETSTNKLSITTNTFSSITYLCRYFAKDSMIWYGCYQWSRNSSVCPSQHTSSPTVLSEICVVQTLVFCVIFCRSLFGLLAIVLPVLLKLTFSGQPLTSSNFTQNTTAFIMKVLS